MATPLQEKAVPALIENGRRRKPRSQRKVLVDVGYSQAMADKPALVTESKGFKEVLASYGLTEELVVEALVEDIKDKKGKRYNELSLGSEILGIKKQSPNGPITNNILIIADDQRARIARRAITRVRGVQESSN